MDVVVSRQLNVGPDHLSHIETGEEKTNLEEGMPDALCVEISLAHSSV